MLIIHNVVYWLSIDWLQWHTMDTCSEGNESLCESLSISVMSLSLGLSQSIKYFNSWPTKINTCDVLTNWLDSESHLPDHTFEVCVWDAYIWSVFHVDGVKHFSHAQLRLRLLQLWLDIGRAGEKKKEEWKWNIFLATIVFGMRSLQACHCLLYHLSRSRSRTASPQCFEHIPQLVAGQWLYSTLWATHKRQEEEEVFIIFFFSREKKKKEKMMQKCVTCEMRC